MQGGAHKTAQTNRDRERKVVPGAGLVHGPDLKLALVILAICAIVYYLTTTWEDVPELLAENIPPQWFPKLMVWVIAALALLLPFEHMFSEHGKAGLDAERRERIPLISVVTAVLLVLAVAAVAVFGTFLATVFVCAALPLLWGERRWKILIPYFVLFPIAVALLFTQVLKVYFQPGWFGFEI